MSSDGVVGGELVAEPWLGDLVVAREGSLLILQGPKDAVERLIANEPALQRRGEPAASRAGAVASLANLQALVPTSSGATQQVFKLDATGMKQLKLGQLRQAADGSIGTVARDSKGRFLKQGKLIPVDVNPTDALNVQMALVTLALTSAINEVAEAVARVEDKVDRLADLLDSDRVGAIVGAHHALVRRAEAAGPDGSLADADWHAIDDVGIQVEQQIEALRSFVRKRLVAAEGQGTGVTDRRDALNHVAELSEALGLLVVAQDSLFLFQQLRVARIRDTEPARLPAALDEARSLLSGHEKDDAELLGRVRQVVTDRAHVKELEIHRFMATSELASTAGEVDKMLDWFGSQRTLAHEPIGDVEVPGIGDAVGHVRSNVATAARDGRRMLGSAKDRIRKRDKAVGELETGDEMPELLATTDADQGEASGSGQTASSVHRFRSGLTKAGRGGVNRFRGQGDNDPDPDNEPEDETTDA